MAESSNDVSHEQALALLEQVKVVSFTADPYNLAPFQASVLRWRVEAPAQVKIKLDGVGVPNTGSKSVQPEQTRIYRLSASVGNAFRPLEEITLQVDLNTCAQHTTSGMVDFMRAGINQAILGSSKVEFQVYRTQAANGTITETTAEPIVFVEGQQIKYVLPIKEKGGPVKFYIKGAFGVGVGIDSNPMHLNATKLIAINEIIDIDVSAPWYYWLLPIVAIIRLGAAQDKVWQAMKEMHVDLVNVIPVILPAPKPAANKQVQHAELIINPFGNGECRLTYCPLNTDVVH